MGQSGGWGSGEPPTRWCAHGPTLTPRLREQVPERRLAAAASVSKALEWSLQPGRTHRSRRRLRTTTRRQRREKARPCGTPLRPTTRISRTTCGARDAGMTSIPSWPAALTAPVSPLSCPGRIRPQRTWSGAHRYATVTWCSPSCCAPTTHVDHTFLAASHYRDDDGVLTVHVGDEEVARFSAGSYRHEATHVRDKDGRVRPARRLEIQGTGQVHSRRLTPGGLSRQLTSTVQE